MLHSSFIPETWITFTFENRFFVGRTQLVADNFEMVSAVSESGEMLILAYSRVSNVKHLKFVRPSIPGQPEPVLKSHEFYNRWN